MKRASEVANEWSRGARARANLDEFVHATRPHTSWRPLRVYRHSEELHTTVSTVYGYRAQCRDCSWLGPARNSARDARDDARWHECRDAA